MADVIRLEDRLVRPSPKLNMEPAAPSNAVILFFTGIRYERLDGYPGTNPAAPVPGNAQTH